jgi:hypothetical protein
MLPGASVSVDVGMVTTPVVLVHVDMEQPPPPPDEEPDCETGDHDAHGRLGALLHGPRKVLLVQEDRQPEREEG